MACMNGKQDQRLDTWVLESRLKFESVRGDTSSPPPFKIVMMIMVASGMKSDIVCAEQGFKLKVHAKCSA